MKRAPQRCDHTRRLLLRAAALACAAAGAALLTAAAPAAAQGGAALERSVKAAFLYKFLGYTEFPAGAFGDAGAPVVIGVVGSDEMAAELLRIVAGRSIGSRPLLVRQLRDGDAAGAVHLLFVAGADSARAARALHLAPGPVLLVTECGNGLQLGSIINFKIVEERVRFDVSLEAADKANIKLSSRLLTVANHVSKGAP
ncbi:MAG: YfiR family protein [Pseudomonadota bacterium]|nr:YfiR family protein [Pseudomonadota bacterium]